MYGRICPWVVLLGVVALGTRGQASSQGSGGRLVTPTPRCSMWRHNTSCPRYNNDDKLSCDYGDQSCNIYGNYDNEYHPTPQEEGGQCDCHVTSATYTVGQTIKVEVNVAVATGGWYEFLLYSREANKRVSMTGCYSSDCPTQYLLVDKQGQHNFTKINVAKVYKHNLVLPSKASGQASLLQWRYHRDGQAVFYSVADVELRVPACRAIRTGPYASLPGLDDWCKTDCNWVTRYCPSNFCVCPL